MELVSRHLALSSRLKPEARLGLAISEFAQCLDSERRLQFLSMQHEQDAQISGQDIIKITEEINQEGKRRHWSWRPHGTKVAGFLSRIQTFATIGDVLVGGSQNLIATGVWSAVRLSLTSNNIVEIATSYLSYFEKLSTLFMRLGTSWALHEDFAQLFPASEVLQAYFCEYLVVLLKLCNKIVVFSQKNTRVQLLSSLGSSFDSEFGPVQRELDQWGSLIQQQTQLLATRINIDTQKGKFEDLWQRILRRLSPCQNDFDTRWRRQRKKGTCEWLFDTPAFKDWKCMQTSATLSISGKLGSGKTVSMANLVARLNLDQPCAYVFCASQEPISLKATYILGSIAYNLVRDLPTESITKKNAQTNYARRTFDPETIIDLLLSLLPEDRKYIVIADGLESCPDADINDVLAGLHRLIRCRNVLFCYSSRSDSRFQQIAKEHLTLDFSINHDDVNHDSELEAYIVKEVRRRNSSRHLRPDLEELVKAQLIAGAQGMYLWFSLQLDTIFPVNSTVVVTDDQVLNIVTHLPKDLPEAFEQALERIPDPRYEGSIMKLVMSAITPLDLDEIRVALCVVVGEPVWHPERIARDGLQLISLCGGNLLDLDEEDGRVRFIHHSVIQHLLAPASSGRTKPYHFTVEDAENFIGATCVTYLHLPILDSRITVTKSLQSQDVLDNVVKTTRGSVPGVSRLIEHIKGREHKRARPSKVDIGQILTQLQATRIQDETDPRCFAGYASTNWMFHTRFFDEETQDCKKTWRLWWRLLYGGLAGAKAPCPNVDGDPLPVLLWAVEHGHGSLFRTVLGENSLREPQLVEIIHKLASHRTIHGHWLGDVLAQYFHGLHSIKLPQIAPNIKVLLDLEANPSIPHHISDAQPLQILLSLMSAAHMSDIDEDHLVRLVFHHPTISGFLEDRSLLEVLHDLEEQNKSDAVNTILEIHPNLKFEVKRERPGLNETSTYPRYLTLPDPEVDVQSRPLRQTAIERALENRRWEEVVARSERGINTPTSLGVSLLWTAIETMDDTWVYHLLELGADPNAGPFAMNQRMDSRRFVAECFPLEAAVWLRRTRVCLELIRHGARVYNPESLGRIAEETGNSILTARLYEETDWLQRQKKISYWKPNERGRTALSTACKMLSFSGSGAPPGLPMPLHISDSSWDWKSELDKIIYRLALEANFEYLNARDVEGRTALHHLAEANTRDADRLNTLVNLLLGRGADPNVQDLFGKTPLKLAIESTKSIDSFVRPLLEAGATLISDHPQDLRDLVYQVRAKYQGSGEDASILVSFLLQTGPDPGDASLLGSIPHT